MSPMVVPRTFDCPSCGASNSFGARFSVFRQDSQGAQLDEQRTYLCSKCDRPARITMKRGEWKIVDAWVAKGT